METTAIDYWGSVVDIEHFTDEDGLFIESVKAGGVDISELIGRQQLEELERLLKKELREKAEQDAADHADYLYHDWFDRRFN